MSLSVFDVLTADRIALNLQVSNQGEAISGTLALLRSSPHVLDLKGLEREILEREKLSATAAGNGIAFPHARTACVDQVVVAAGRTREGVLFPGGESVQLLFVIGTPKNMVREYLGLVGDLARRVRQASVREQLVNAGTAADFLTALRTASRS
jgi:mannitol/fructose-specific phosphotransferase system IIA component (Ntr-type)